MLEESEEIDEKGSDLRSMFLKGYKEFMRESVEKKRMRRISRASIELVPQNLPKSRSITPEKFR